MSLLGIVSKFKHKGEIRESKDEILTGEIVFLMAQHGWPAMGFTRRMLGVEVGGTTDDLQHMRFRTPEDEVLHSVHVRLDRKSGTGALSAALVGSKATLYVKGETRNQLADPDDLVQQWATDIKNILKLPLLGQVKVNHELNSIFAEKGQLIDLDHFVLAGQEGRDRLEGLLVSTVDELRRILAPYKKKS